MIFFFPCALRTVGNVFDSGGTSLAAVTNNPIILTVQIIPSALMVNRDYILVIKIVPHSLFVFVCVVKNFQPIIYQKDFPCSNDPDLCPFHKVNAKVEEINPL